MSELLGGQFIIGTIPGMGDGDDTWTRQRIGTPAAKMPEAELLLIVRWISTAYGVDCFHEANSRRQALKGWPDCVLIGRHGVIFRELKNNHSTLTPDQRRIGSRLQASRADWGVWRPAELFSGLIERYIAEIA